jgi:hypothetical protein
MILESALLYYLGLILIEQLTGDPEESYSVLPETLEQFTGDPGSS